MTETFRKDTNLAFPKRHNRKRSPSGCGFVLVQGLLLAAMLLVNGLIVRAFLLANPGVAEDARIIQSAQFVLPLMMIFAELWLYDYLTAKTGGEQES